MSENSSEYKKRLIAERGSYRLKCKCLNCKTSFVYELPRGIPADELYGDGDPEKYSQVVYATYAIPCLNCGCCYVKKEE